ncbi:DAK [Lepeophtheirus salmonis]|uniref:DAK n=1 Tax=Lepeophtheirus salmonis TaxID=72036 RepID=A0A7R8H914_LEPSM|nr:DAK [Lepeophtheirus salmonis]CAF2951345.1 DAK [Lepeophtheirus salmonis]
MSAPCMLGSDGSVDDYLDNLIRGDDLRERVALISGGGSGHEPSFAGYVGPGCLTAAVVGNLFASPPVDHILGAMRGVSTGASGILLLPMNYTGDRLNFGMALQKFKSLFPHIPAEMILVEDDCGTSEDRRGVAGTVLVHKIAGAMASLGKPLQEIVHFLSSKILPKLGSIGLSLSPLRLPGREEDSFNLHYGEMELGTGIHGEAGVKRLKLQSAKESTMLMFQKFIEF